MSASRTVWRPVAAEKASANLVNLGWWWLDRDSFGPCGLASAALEVEKVLLSGQSVGRRERFEGLAIDVMAHRIRLGACKVIPLRMHEGSDGAAQLGGGDVGFQKWTDFFEEADGEGPDRIARGGGKNADRANEQRVDRFRLSNIYFGCRDWSTAGFPSLIHALTSLLSANRTQL